MSDELSTQVTFFNDSVAEYKNKQKEVLGGFITGCVELGEILLKTKKALKEEGEISWSAYLKEIGLHVTQAGQQIRIFEYSQKKLNKDVLGTVITNWEKLNLFLALPEEQREKILQKNLDTATTMAEFRESIVEVKSEDTPIIKDEDLEDNMWKKIEENVGWNPLLVDTKKAAKRVGDDLKMSVDARDILEGILLIEKTKEILKAKITLSVEEKEQLRLLYGKQLVELELALNEFFS